MRLRSLLFVPADRPERFDKAAASGADAIILDLEDSVAPGNKAQAREAAARYLAAPASVLRFVRVNPIDGEYFEQDLQAIAGADAVMMPKAEGASSISRLLARLPATMPVLPIATETPKAIFTLGSYGEVADRLCGLTWGAEDLPAAVGARSSRREDGSYTPPYELARSLTLFAAHAAQLAAIETVFPAIRDLDGLARYARRGADDGFTGMMALHPDQVPVINAAFTPSEADIAAAREVIAAFDAAGSPGVLLLNGRMFDKPHLIQARRILERAEQHHKS